MAQTARVGVVIRTKDRPWFLARALGDVAAQLFADWRVTVINDGGDAHEVDAIVARLPESVRSRVGVEHNATSRGRSAAANQGVKALSTEFVVLHDDDDLWDPRFLLETTQWLDANENDIGVVVRTEIVFETASPDGFVEAGRETFWADLHAVTFTDLLEVNRWVPIAYLYRRELHERVGYYDETIHAAEDWEFGLRTLAAHTVGFIDSPALAFWMQRPDVEGDLGNSMFVLAQEHERYDARIRDRALREYVTLNGAGLVLYISELIGSEGRKLREDLRTAVREEIARELDARPTLVERAWRRFARPRRRP